jgi:hypothetical protein
MSAIVSIRLAQLCSEVKTYVFDHNPTVGELFDAANKTFKDGCITVGGSVVCADHMLYNNDLVILGEAVKGNIPMTVTFIRLGGDPPSSTVAVEQGSTVEQAVGSLPAHIKAQFILSTGAHAYEYRIDGTRLVEANAEVPYSGGGSSDVRIICSQRVKGNR